jgi:hypothetical protein
MKSTVYLELTLCVYVSEERATIVILTGNYPDDGGNLHGVTFQKADIFINVI